MFAADVELRFKGQEAYLHNTAYNTLPVVVHGNGPSKLVLNTLGNYLANSWNPEDGCLSCWDDSVVLEDKEVSAVVHILLELSCWQELQNQNYGHVRVSYCGALQQTIIICKTNYTYLLLHNCHVSEPSKVILSVGQCC